MLVVYSTKESCSVRHVEKWLNEHSLNFRKRKITKRTPLTEVELIKILSITENGFDDLIRNNTSLWVKLGRDKDTYSTNEMISLIIENPNMLRNPIIIRGKKLVLGFHKNEIRSLVPHKERVIQLGKYLVELSDSDFPMIEHID